MAKGFGSSRQGELGYVLMLLPKVKAYAADFATETLATKTGDDEEEFIGITGSLELAQVWKKKSEARQAVVKYIELLIDELEDKSQIKISIRKLRRLKNGKLQDEPEEDLIFERES